MRCTETPPSLVRAIHDRYFSITILRSFIPGEEGPSEKIEIAMATTSTRSIRIRGVAAETTIASFEESLSTIRSTTNEKKSIFSWASPSTPSSPIIKLNHSLADQNDYKTATVTFTDEDAKDRAIQEEYPEEWVIDDIFNGVTILYAPEKRYDEEVTEIECVLCNIILGVYKLTSVFHQYMRCSWTPGDWI
jgi:hypothetical protein